MVLEGEKSKTNASAGLVSGKYSYLSKKALCCYIFWRREGLCPDIVEWTKGQDDAPFNLKPFYGDANPINEGRALMS
jgi:hypothetical protein